MSHTSSNLASNANIPLHCHVCSKKPAFSDVSHLLTHIASKGHLSAYYKMKLSDNAHDRDIIANYDEWYEMWNVEELMKERLEQKEKKKGAGGSGRASSASTSRHGSAATHSAPHTARNTPTPSIRSNARRNHRRQDLLDPQLLVHIKMEPGSRAGTPVAGPLPPYQPAPHGRGFGLPGQGWATGYAFPSPHPPSSLLSSGSSAPSSDSDFDDYGRGNELHPLPGVHGGVPRQQGDGPGPTLRDTKLGLPVGYVQGFDTADSEGRRTRNQKKPPSKLRELIATSTSIQPIESVLKMSAENDSLSGELWALKAEREITGVPNSDDSHVTGETTPEAESPPKKKKSTTTTRTSRTSRNKSTALANKNINTGRIQKLRRDSHQQGTMPSMPTFGSQPYFGTSSNLSNLGGHATSHSPRMMGPMLSWANSGPTITMADGSILHPMHQPPMLTSSHTPPKRLGSPFEYKPRTEQTATMSSNPYGNVLHPSMFQTGNRMTNNANPLGQRAQNASSFGFINANMGPSYMFGTNNPLSTGSADLSGISSYNCASMADDVNPRLANATHVPEMPSVSGSVGFSEFFSGAASGVGQSEGLFLLEPDFAGAENDLFGGGDQVDDNATISAPVSEQ